MFSVTPLCLLTSSESKRILSFPGPLALNSEPSLQPLTGYCLINKAWLLLGTISKPFTMSIFVNASHCWRLTALACFCRSTGNPVTALSMVEQRELVRCERDEQLCGFYILAPRDVGISLLLWSSQDSWLCACVCVCTGVIPRLTRSPQSHPFLYDGCAEVAAYWNSLH